MKLFLSLILSYYIQCTMFAITVCKKLDRINMNFIWGSMDQKRKIHLINWVKLQNHNFRGLGIQYAVYRNKALSSSLGWILKKETTPWATMLRNRMFKHNGNLLTASNKTPCNWKAIYEGMNTLKMSSGWVVANGRNIKFWHDTWVGSKSWSTHEGGRQTNGRGCLPECYVEPK